MLRHIALTIPSLALLVFTACDSPATTGPESESAAEGEVQLAKGGVPASPSESAPGAPIATSVSFTFPDDDPCTPTFDSFEHMVTISGTVFFHFLPNGNVVVRFVRTIITDSGYEGSGKLIAVENGQISKNTFNDIVSHPDGRKFRVHGVLVMDLTTMPPTTRVSMAGLTCIKT